MKSTPALTPIVEEYQLKWQSFTFWTPYIKHEPGLPKGPYKGKGTPAQIQAQVNKIMSLYQDPIYSGEEIRYLMVRNNLGVDCSGFVYYVLDQYLRRLKLGPLGKQLFVEKTEALEALKRPSWQRNSQLTAKQINNLPRLIPLEQVCRAVNRSPRRITGVARLVHPASTVPIKLTDLQPGDMLPFTGTYGAHIWLVTDTSDKSVTYAQSVFDPVGPGGVSVSTVATKHFIELTQKHHVKAPRRLKTLV